MNAFVSRIVGHYESRKRGSATDDASWLHRFDLFTYLRGIYSVTKNNDYFFIKILIFFILTLTGIRPFVG